MGRAPCCDKANVKKGQWSPEEDAALKTYLETHGTGGNWIHLPQKAGKNFHGFCSLISFQNKISCLNIYFAPIHMKGLGDVGRAAVCGG